MKFSLLGIAALIGVASISSAHAGVIIGAAGVTTDIPGDPRGGGDIINLINQSGLSNAYVSGVTDFDAFVANTHDSSTGLNTWNGAATSGNITFDLGGVQSIESMALWNRDFTGSGIANFNLRFSNTSDFTASTLVTGFTAADIAAGGTSALTLAQVFTFAVVEAAFVRLEILSSYGASTLVSGEVIFEQAVSDVPLPAALPLFLLGMAGFGAAARRKRAV